MKKAIALLAVLCMVLSGMGSAFAADFGSSVTSAQEAEEVTVSVENVKGGVINTFDMTGMKSLPIGEEVKITSGNMLVIKAFGMNNASGDKITKSVSVSTKIGTETETLTEFPGWPDTYMFTVTEDTVITGVFESIAVPAQEGMSVYTEQEYFPVTGADAEVQTQLAAVLDGQTVSGAIFSASDANFTVTEEGILESNAALTPGEYTVNVTVTYGNQTYSDVEVSVKVGSAVKFYQYLGENMGAENGPNLVVEEGNPGDPYPVYFAEGTTIAQALEKVYALNYQPMYNYDIDPAVFSDADGNEVTSDEIATTDDVNIFYTRYVNESGQRYTLTVPALSNEEPQVDEVTVSIENVKGGVLNTFDIIGLKSLPIGEKVKVPSGNMLVLKAFGMNNASGDKITKSISVSIKTTDGTTKLEELELPNEEHVMVKVPDTYMFNVTKDTVITGVFESIAVPTQMGMMVKTQQEYFPVEETTTDVETQLIAALDGKTISGATFSASDANFTVSGDGLLKSKADLAPGEYIVKVTVGYNNQTYSDTEVSVKVGSAVKVYQYLGENMGFENGPNLIEDANYPIYFAKGTTMGEALAYTSYVNYQPMYNYNIDTTVFSDVNGNPVTYAQDATTGDINIFYTRYVKASGDRYKLTVSDLSSGNTGGSKSGGSSSVSTSAAASSLAVTTNDSKAIVTQTIAAVTGTNGVATGSVTKDQISDMIKSAKEKAQEQNKQIALEIKVKPDKTVSGIAVTIPKEAVTTLTDGADGLIISSPIFTVNLDKDVLNQIRKNIAGELTITVLKANVDDLSNEDKAMIGDRPVYDLKINSGSTSITDFGGGTATVSIPYTPVKGEDTSKLVIYYISNSGQLTMIPDCIYDESNGTVTFKTTHFSSYAIGYNDVAFSDVSGWYAPYVNFLSARELINGTGAGKFSPNANITRAEFVMILANFSDNYVGGAAASSFSDVAVSDWYFKAIQWAYENDIVYGSDGKFNPNDTLTRQDIAVMLTRYVEKVAKYQLTETNKAVEFTDSAKISSYASSSVTAMQRAGIISGGSDGSFAPKEKATRAQTAKMVALLVQDMLED
ncbi:S-layer homology domain-containing protein [Clostridium aminobutyricum]|uniref:S-layer homology domain-containing protein n=1 Tax=Clostridium aminobutyricum TaxID=33953 RepID=A0A939DA29_CLOAM|nr:S-layer homology domain-containing protein [Clostridium aminobutyricum]MBN7773946.1 S-layer homology domain-containing protein [Clostridium aminobutyricum]